VNIKYVEQAPAEVVRSLLWSSEIWESPHTFIS